MVRADYAQRVQRAWNLRVAGMGWDEIAETVGYSSRSNVIRAVQRYTGTLPTVDTESLRLLSRERGEYLWRHAANEVERTKGGANAVRTATDVLRHQDSLYGLGQQTVRVQSDPTPDELARVVSSLLASVGVVMPMEADIFDPRYNDVVDAEVVEDMPGLPVAIPRPRQWSPEDYPAPTDDDEEVGTFEG